LPGQLDREEILVRSPEISDRATIFPLRSASLSTPELVRDRTRMQPP
jgi:hypothetical protein